MSDIKALRRRVAPIVEVVLPCPGGPHCTCEAVRRAAMLAVAEAQRDQAQQAYESAMQIVEIATCHCSSVGMCAGHYIIDAGLKTWLAAAEALVAELKEIGMSEQEQA